MCIYTRMTYVYYY